MYICCDCGSVLDEDELHTERSYVSDYMGGSYEDTVSCPCGGEIVEAEKCSLCGEYYRPEDMQDDICIECIKSEMTVDNAIECGKDGSAREDVSINGFLASIFSKEKIDEILIRELERLIDSSDECAMHVINKAEEWCNGDVSYFADWLKSRQKQKG